jgi:mannose-1-phosphate guanylyltransferase
MLAGGDGTRLQNLTRKIAGDSRPKQFCSITGTRDAEMQGRCTSSVHFVIALGMANRDSLNFSLASAVQVFLAQVLIHGVKQF